MHLPECEITFCRYFHEKERFDFEYEIYEEYVLFCIYSGTFQYRIGDKQPHAISAGEVIVCPPNEAFYRQMLLPSSFLMIKLKPNDTLYFPEFPVTIEDNARFMQNLEHLAGCNFFFDFAGNKWWLHYCVDIWYQLISTIANPQKSLEKIIPFSIQTAHDNILQNYRLDLSIHDIAKSSGFSTVHFINTFRKYYHYTPKQYLLFVRMQKAQQLLENTSDSIQTIAKECGFHDEFYFSRLFHQRFGMTPTEYKKLTAL